MTFIHLKNTRFYGLIFVFTIALLTLSKNGNCQNNAISFNGINNFVTFGNDTNLHLKQYTLECWFKRSGQGVASFTGNYGVYAYPLVTKGVTESEVNTRDMNFFMGIDSITNVLVSDFEEGFNQFDEGRNQPVFGTTPILWNVWYHAAVTFDENQITVYLNGQPEMSTGLGVIPQYESIQHAGVAAGITSYGIAKGYFQGEIDEVRIWNYARSVEDIQNNINVAITTPKPGLVGCWGFNEASGDTVYDASVNGIKGIIKGTGTTRVPGAPLNMVINYVPDDPTVISPIDNDTCIAVNDALLKVHAFDPGGDTITVKYYGRPAFNSPAKFTLIPLPDTQHYVAEIDGGTNEGLKAQTSWIVANRASRKIRFVTQLGDCVENGNNGGDDIEWRRADTAFAMLEDPFSTGLTEGIPYSISVGNHDQTGMGNPNGSTLFYNQYFGFNRFGSRAYYGGHYGVNHDNHYSLFSASGMDFIEVSLEYDTAANPVVINWADSVIQAFPNRHAIVTSHYLLNLDATFSNQGQAVYDQLKHNPNLFLMLCGHKSGESYRSDVYNGHTVYTIVSDYQSRSIGGNGWLKILEFRPALNKVFVSTYSPYINKYETDWDSEFNFDFPMTTPYQLLGTVTVTAGSESSFLWSGLQMDSSYEWYAVMSDGKYEKTSDLIRFSTNNNEQIYVGSDISQCGGQATFGTNDSNYTYLWSTGSTNSHITVNQSGNYILTATSIAGNCPVKDTMIVAINPIPVSYLGTDTTLCGQLILGATTDTNYVYTWQDNNHDPVFTATNTGTYSLYIQDSVTGCFSSDTINLVIYPLPIIELGSDTVQCGGSIDIGVSNTGNTYLWSTGSTDSIINVNSSGQYILTATSLIGGCVSLDTIEVTINPIPIVDLGADTAHCSELTLLGTPGSNYIYNWSDGSNQRSITTNLSGTYWLLLQDGLTGCFNSDTIEVTVYPDPIVNLGNDITQCGGVVVIGNNDPLNSYVWSTGETDAQITVSQSGSYQVTATSYLGSCIAGDSINIVINEIPPLNMPSDTSECDRLVLNADIGSGYNYIWQDGNHQPERVVNESGEYIITAEDIITGCLKTDTINVEIYPLPNFELGADTSCTKCDFNLVVPGGYQSYLWNTGALSNTIHVSYPGSYSVTVTDNHGCVSRDSIVVLTSALIYPNPVNDYLIINLPSYPTVPTFEIFDELGRAITFEFKNLNADYLINTRNLAKGVYFLVVTSGSEEHRFKVVKQ